MTLFLCYNGVENMQHEGKHEFHREQRRLQTRIGKKQYHYYIVVAYIFHL